MFLIKGRLGKNKFELIDKAKNIEVALYLLGQYKLAFGKNWELKIEFK